jgi:hypothetical protein
LEEDLAMADDDPDAFFEDEMWDQRREADIDRLRHRMTLLFILIPCLLCAVFAFAYMDVRGRLKQLQSSGSQKVEALSEDVIEKVSSLSEQFKELEESFGKRLSILKDVSVTIQNDVKKSETKLQALAGATIDKKTFDDAATGLESLKESMAKQDAAIRGLSKKLQKELDQEATAIAAFQSDLRVQGERFTETVSMIEDLQQKALKLELKTRLLSENMIDKDTWEEVKGKTAWLEKKTKDLVEEFAWLTKQLNLTREKKTVSKPEPSEPEKEKAKAPVSSTIVPKSGKIEEQEIKE